MNPNDPARCNPHDRADRARHVSLTVLGPGGRVRRSRAGPWRAAVLIFIHLAIVAHIVQWTVSGMRDGVRQTLSPLEPSESMQTLEQGTINAGFVLFGLAILSTLILGRFFCGWGCHVIGLQDLCAWIMKKLGVHPKPWRSRLLLWVPLGLAIYMFVWPTFRREVVAPACRAWFGGVPDWVGVAHPFPGFTSHFIVEDFWATFAPWYIAIPFFLVCAFATVYFMGSKAFCTYGCPYGGFFAPADRLSPVRIRVTDACEHCGHCTAVCTSNVRVSDEVRDYGMVIDPGCMKCMDCVSVCPNDALYLGVGAPALFARPRSDGATLARAAAQRAGRYDLSLREEVVFLLVFMLLFRGYRGMYDSVPLLMAVGIAMVGTFMVHKAWRLVRDANVRGPYWQLKRAGRVRPAGWAFLAVTVGLVAVGAQGLTMWYGRWQAELAYIPLSTIKPAELFSEAWSATDAQKASARRVIALDRLAGPISDGGVGFMSNGPGDLRLWWCSAVLGERAEAERYLRRALEGREPRDDLVFGLAQLMNLRKAAPAEIEAEFLRFVDRWPEHDVLRRAVATQMLRTGRADAAVAMYERAVSPAGGLPYDIPTVLSAASVCFEVDLCARALPWLRRALEVRTHSPDLWDHLAIGLFLDGQDAAAEGPLRRAIELAPSYDRWMRLAELLSRLGRAEEASKAQAEARRLAPHPSTPSAPPGSGSSGAP